jgi:hypothetical protein
MNEEQKYLIGERRESSPFSGSRFLITPDNISQSTRLQLRAGWRYSKVDSLNFTSSVHKFQYDTPAKNNFDDRDEIRIKINIQSFHDLSPGLKCRFSLSTHLLHLVYIYGRRSADNNWTRIIRFQPELHWQPSANLSISQSVKILANYVSYDFDELSPTIKSFLYRKLTIADTLDYSFSENCKINLNYQLELDENGKFLINDWSEQRIIDRKGHTFGISCRLEVTDKLILSPGYNYYLRKGFQYKSFMNSGMQRNLSQQFHSFGPNFVLKYSSRKLLVLFRGSRLISKTLNSISNNILTRVNLSCRWFF